MILAGDEAQVQVATVGVRPHLSGPRGSLASPEGRSAFRELTLSLGIPPRADDGAGTFVPPASGGHALMTPSRVCLIPIRIRCRDKTPPSERQATEFAP